MLDKQSTAMLKLIVEASPDGESVAIEKKDFLHKISKSVEIDEDALKEAGERLSIAGLINIIYQDEETYVVASLTKGRVAAEKISSSKKADLGTLTTDFSAPINLKKVFEYAFMGAFIGGILAGVIFGILSKLI